MHKTYQNASGTPDVLFRAATKDRSGNQGNYLVINDATFTNYLKVMMFLSKLLALYVIKTNKCVCRSRTFRTAGNLFKEILLHAKTYLRVLIVCVPVIRMLSTANKA